MYWNYNSNDVFAALVCFTVAYCSNRSNLVDLINSIEKSISSSMLIIVHINSLCGILIIANSAVYLWCNTYRTTIALNFPTFMYKPFSAYCECIIGHNAMWRMHWNVPRTCLLLVLSSKVVGGLIADKCREDRCQIAGFVWRLLVFVECKVMYGKLMVQYLPDWDRLPFSLCS